ncbi:nicotinate-nucleotide--dimethylbenzimidazole phosphoribosyltransferase [Alkalilimnicola ehrlichii]|uniref:Nicotinate-nucleotide--dimethylbenzimidazole phosphoribosyltransferase n=1 Tax=Alkalilimnicola ehrlichii TaxID=351052 RepID=A0A3E0WP66_9GAMM|nr:nicotinate-nucleotide--dimethylbenzimidazole phosphoribosyltransferase [Alkalilimnicola ehrlichii]RFA26846.1 nicotinate-nucleotide--dimethylbenzimidazole phosphoribosyltransferase [Alkalilimnicola ehrlichii]RFA33941.1 nicotinate-nucleotide--dimethylbenzimidazole phosphoribosyltransferase [Alkalilimnicola ehrlichii]
MSLDWVQAPAAAVDEEAQAAALARQGQLTKPPGSLGRLESLAVQLAGLQGVERPTVERVQISLFAGDHGVAEEGVSAFPQAVTIQMLQNFASGGAAISVLARQLNAKLEVVDCGTLAEAPIDGVIRQAAGAGTANFCKQPAMTAAQLATALAAGRDAVARAEGVALFIGGEMGIANTTAATALACALLNAAPSEITGPGTGLDQAGVAHKAAVIERALALHEAALGTPLAVLQHLGGFEIAALVGAFVHAAQRRLPVLVDGFITTAAALVAVRANPAVRPWLLFAHQSAEPGHRALLKALEAEPVLGLEMRLGEASGAATAVPVLRLACALHNEMATFAEAGVAERND